MVLPPQIPGLSQWRPLARGGFATVWEARQESLNRLVAVKVDQRTLDAPDERRRFLTEAGAAGRMSGHPGFVTVHDAGLLTDDRPYLVMELCPGGSLTRWLSQDPRPGADRVREVGVRVADALAAAHAQGVLHRDVKPANILIDAYGHPGLADFGLAALPEPDDERSAAVEALTPGYAAPEVVRLERPTDRSDVYALAATLHALLTGSPPASGGSGDGDGDDDEARGAGADARLLAVIRDGLATDPADRPTAAEFRDRLAALGPDRGATAARPARRRSRGRVVAALTVLVLAVLGTGAYALTRGTAVTGAAVGREPAPGAPASPGASAGATSTAAASTGATSTGAPTASAPAGRSASPSAVAPPRGFTRCGSGAGAALCPVVAECWGGVFSYADSLNQGTPARCDRTHVYQTFAAGTLVRDYRRQSQVDADRSVRRVCTARVANSTLPRAQRRDDWEVIALPPQGDEDPDRFYRCIVGRGERATALDVGRLS